MKTTSQKIRTSFVTAAAILFAAPLASQSASQVDVVNLYDDNPWDVIYLDSIYNPLDNTTTFTYEVTVDGDPDLSHFNIEMPAGCELVSVSGPDEVGRDGSAPDEYSLVQWFKWDEGQGDGSEIYSLVLEGEVSEGLGNVAVKAGLYYAVGEITAPSCADVTTPETLYSASGIVFMDADLSGLNEDEPGISNVTVELHDSEGNIVATTTTSESGDYEFTGLPSGDYTLVVLTENDIPDDFNEVLADYFFATTEIEITLSGLDEDSEGNDFGFAPDAEAIIDDFDSEDPDGNGVVFQGDGKTIGFWKHQNSVANKGKGHAQVDAETLQGYIDAIEELLLPDLFQFDDANEFKAAYDVMAMRTSDAVELLKKQLLATEFNDVAGRGLEAPLDELQDKLIAWGEHLAANSDLFTRDELIDAKDIFDLINNTGNM